MKLTDKLGGMFIHDKFETEFRNILKNLHLHIISHEGKNSYELANGTASFRFDTTKARTAYEKNPTDEKLEKIIRRLEKEVATKSRMISFTNGQEFLRLMLMREKDVKRQMISEDFVEGLKKVVVYTPDDETIFYLDEAILKRWSVPKEVVFSVADRNMCRLLEKAQLNEEDLPGGLKALEIKIPSAVFSSSLILCNDFHSTVKGKFSEKFFVVAPSRENMLVLKNLTNDVMKGLGTVVLSDYRKAKNPLTTDVLLFTGNDVRIVGRFSIGHNDNRED
ncbi:MAG: hypothetical protein J6A05_05745 [Oscillospiraceae bacterium]|nr:hypothetical protein [Oscillospiraceae bacterium]